MPRASTRGTGSTHECSIPTFMPASSIQRSAYERLLADLEEELRTLDAQGLLRQLIPIDAVDGAFVRIGGRELVCWCSNDYLGLAQHPALAAAAARAATQSGVGARASRLLAGTTSWHIRLEEALSAWFGVEEAIVFASGYLANLGALGALLSSDDAVIIDRLAHASLLDASRATGASLRVFRHNDVSHAAALLARASGARRRCLVTEGVFSMDGDRAPLAQLLDVAEAHDAVLYLDDAHGAFVLGATGRGTPEAAGISLERFLYMGTLGKALGCQGGFVAGPQALIRLLHNRARTFLYATALAVPVTAAALEALQVLKEEPERRVHLEQRARTLHARLQSLGMPGVPMASHIVPLVVGESARALALASRLQERGIWAPAIRPPTVPKGTARLRLSVTALHTDAHIDALIAALQATKALNS